MNRTRGFTLIEMLTVVVIVGIILAIGIPMMNSMSRATALQGAIRDVSNTLQLARQFAITHRTKTEVRIDNTTWNAISVFTNQTYQVDKWKRLPVGTIIQPSGTDDRIFFKPTGDSVGGGTIIIREGSIQAGNPVATNKNVGTITVTPVLGRITIKTPGT